MSKIIEFTGLPNSGKTTLIHRLAEELPKHGFTVDVMREDAEIVPNTIPKKTWARNMWITFGQLQSLITANHSVSDFVLLDRGIYDALFWAKFMNHQGACTNAESVSMTNILSELRDLYGLNPDYVFVINVSVEESVKRRMGISRDTVYSKNDFLGQYLDYQDKFFETVKGKANIITIDSTHLSKEDLYKAVLEKIL